jgi:putative membrane protein
MYLKSLALSLLFPIAALPALAEAADPMPQAFAQQAALGNEFEIAESQMALRNSSNPDVIAFAQQMIHDHGMAQRMLHQIGAPMGVETGFIFDRGHQAMLDALSSKSGPDFDAAYLADQRDSHADAEATLGDYAMTGTDPMLRTYARQTLPAVRMHARMLQQMPSM